MLDKKQTLGRIFSILALFPYISLIPLGSDTQPWALLFGTLLLVLWRRDIELTPLHLGLFVMFISATLMVIFEGGGVGSIRNLVGYTSLFVISLISTQIMRNDSHNLMRLIDVSIVIWIFIGIIQKLISKDAFTFLISSARTDESRGVIGLSPEPTFYATMILLMVLWRGIEEVKIWHIISLIFVTIFLASSSQILIITILSGIILLSISIFRSGRFILSAFSILIGSMAVLFILHQMQDTRLGRLASIAIENPSLILLRDASANERFVHIFAGLYSFVDNYFLPNGILTDPWKKYINHIIDIFPNIFWIPQGGDRIMSAIGAIIYQMGFISIFLFICILSSLHKWNKDRSYKIIWGSTFGLVMLTALPLGHPLVGVLLGGLAYVSSKKEREPLAFRPQPASD